MYYPDLEPYSYSCKYKGVTVYCVGWLDQYHRYRKGEHPGFYERLAPYAFYRAHQTLGSDPCPLCGKWGHSAAWGDKGAGLGSAEFYVPSDSYWYVAPNMILHYIKEHEYLPPLDFVRAVMAGPPPWTSEYFDKLRELERHVDTSDWSEREAENYRGGMEIARRSAATAFGLVLVEPQG